MFIGADNNKVGVEDEINTKTKVNLQKDSVIIQGRILHSIEKKYGSEED